MEHDQALTENAKLKEENAKLKEKNEELVSKSEEEDIMKEQLLKTLKFYWSGGLFGEDLIGSVKPDSWDEELEKAQED